ncbi:CBS domain-containing protein [Micromonospora sp. NPDC049523]|uniref:restriction system modified-DNA reader domain-containing protein n=1 Tax=Micromonospora sp. NPDC049523 TaxID=3155921 RepID=UPI0034491E14
MTEDVLAARIAPVQRSRYLLGGRRVRVGDLVEAGLLRPGARLRFVRRRVGETYQAEVTDTGRVRLLPDGQEFRSPSGAAMVAAGMRAVDGWLVWTVEETGYPLDVLRQELLDRAVASAADEPGEETLDRRIHERLRDARIRADGQHPEEFSVRDLLSLWGAKGRGDQISRIEADLANHGLVTSPEFRKVTLDATVRLVVAPRDSDEVSAVLVGPDPTPVDGDDGNSGPIGLTVGNLPSALGGLKSVAPNATIDEAITKMLLNDFSQLAVLNGPRNLRGVVTWRSIAHARHADPHAKLSEAIDSEAVAVRYDRELIDVLPDLQRIGFVFVRNQDNVVAGIVTTADVVQAYGEMALPFFQIGELDRSLRRVIARNLDLDQVARLCSRPVRSFDELSMGEYQRVLSDLSTWTILGWPLDRATFIERLDEIRQIRNDIMHFNPDPPPPDTIDKLRKLNSLLRRYGELS